MTPEAFAERVHAIEAEIGKVIVGQAELVRAVMLGLLCEGHAALLHGLQQRGLRFRRGAVHLIGKHHVRKDRTSVKCELPVAQHVRAEDVGGHEIRGELDTTELDTHGLAQSA